MVGGGLAAAVYLPPVFLIAGAFAVAAIADGLELWDIKWLGWRRRVDRTRVLMFLGWFVVTLFWLSGARIVIDNQILL
jgi:hypothetical protein